MTDLGRRYIEFLKKLDVIGDDFCYKNNFNKWKSWDCCPFHQEMKRDTNKLKAEARKIYLSRKGAGALSLAWWEEVGDMEVVSFLNNRDVAKSN